MEDSDQRIERAKKRIRINYKIVSTKKKREINVLQKDEEFIGQRGE